MPYHVCQYRGIPFCLGCSKIRPAETCYDLGHLDQDPLLGMLGHQPAASGHLPPQRSAALGVRSTLDHLFGGLQGSEGASVREERERERAEVSGNETHLSPGMGGLRCL